jgi:hypothetical protein
MMLVATNTEVASYTVKSLASHNSDSVGDNKLGLEAMPFTFKAMLPTAGTVA